MQKTKTKILTILLLSAMTLALFPLVNASTGNIYINPSTVVTPPALTSPLNQHYPAGGVVNLYLGGVGFSGGQFILYLSTNGFSDIVTRNNQPDIPYSATFDVVNLTDIAATHVYTLAGGFTWTIGSGWVNGTIPSKIAGGSYFVKAFDGSQTSVAVTDTSFIVDPSVSVTPTTGNAGTSVTFSGSAFVAGQYLNLSYTVGANPPVWFQNLTQTGVIGNFSVTMPIVDVKQDTATGAAAVASTTINFAAQINGTATIVQALVPFTEFARGIAQVKKIGAPTSEQLPGAGNLFGNNTVYTVANIGVGKQVIIAGNNFFAGNATLKWDNAALATTSANATGWFNTTITVPLASNGLHNITITDANNVVFVMWVTVVPSLQVSPTSGPVGTVVTVTGYGFPAPTTGNSNNATVAFNGIVAPYIASAMIDASGTFTTTFVVPQAPGGLNPVDGYANATGSFTLYASTSFTITALFAVSPSSFANNASLIVTATGTGFKTGSGYICNIDNSMLGMIPQNTGQNYPIELVSDVNGTITVKFIGAGFNPGIHVVSLYENGSSSPAAYAGFTVLTQGDPYADLLTAINATTVATNTTVNLNNAYLKAINATVIAINGNTATLSTSIGTLTTTISSLQTSVSGLQSSVSALSGLSGSISSISSSIATVQTTLGTIQTSLSSLDAVLGAVAGDTATIKTSLGTITTSLTSIGTTVTKIDGDVATVQTTLGTLTGTVNSVKDGVATIQTSLGTMQASIGTLQTDVNTTKDNTASLSPLVIVAIVLALVAAIAAIASIVLMRRKIAG